MKRTGLAALVLLAASLPLRAETLFVPEGFATIQAALAAADDGDVICVTADLTESVVVTGFNGLTLRGQGGVRIDTDDGEPAFLLDDCTGVTLRGFRVRDVASDGIRISGGSGNVVRQCRVQDVSGHGVLVSGSDGARLLKLRVDRPGADGVAVRDSDDVLVEATRVNDAGVDGISLDGAVPLTGSSDGGLVVRCRVTDPLGMGVHVSGDDNTVERCKVVGAAVAGLALRAGSTSTGNNFVRNRVRKGTGDGLVLEGSANRAERNRFVQPGGRGFVLAGTGGHTLERNVCNKAGGDGAHLAPGADGNVFERNRLLRSALDGLDVESDGNTFEKDRMLGSESTGIEVEGTSNTFTKVRSLFSAGFDLVVTQTGNTFIKSKIGSVDPDGDD